LSYEDHDPAERAIILEKLGTARAERKIAEARAAALVPVAAPRRVVTEIERLRAEVAALPFIGPIALAQALERAKEAKVEVDYQAARKSLARSPWAKKTTTIRVEEDDALKCRACGTLNADDAAFCKGCGASMTDDDDTTGARSVVHRDRQGNVGMTIVHPSMQAAPAHVYEFPTAPESKGRR